MRIHYAYMRCL